jgi:hypothetical protein
VPEARELHSNFTAAWRQFGWLPESFSLDLTTEFRGDPGYNLRPEHIESTFYLAAVTGDPQYVRLAKDMMAVVQASRTKCGYTKVHDVTTGEGRRAAALVGCGGGWGQGLWAHRALG